ncbi:MAG: response regulator [Alphaproteobacteria bacterium]|jgi:CheY-like chemotaxis protein|nr:response regulator [Alphaproteobacteria bacterium]
MVVDDNRHMLNLIEEILRGLNIRNVSSKLGAAEAFKEMQISAVDIVICDQMMEPLSGIEFTQLLRTSKDSPDRFVPVIMVTGNSDFGTVRAAREAGVTEFMVKPVSAKGLYARILEVINNPRPFLRTKSFFGPDRRRRVIQFDGGDKRKKTPKEKDPGDVEMIPVGGHA